MVPSRSSVDRPRSVAGRSPHVVIVIVNWNGLPDTLECLHSIAKIDYDNFRVVLVDNGSKDGSATGIRAAFPDVHLIEAKSNLGFAEGNNRGIREALDSDFILLLNNDTTVDANLLDSLVAEAQSDPLTAALGPVICYADDPDEIWCAGLRIGNGSAYGIRLQCTTSILMYNGARVDDLPVEDFDVDAVVGCAMLLRTSVVKEIGMLDASLFMIHEDFDWSLRARAAGYRCRTKSLPGVWHKV
ncbi:MAG: glycosyltransferase family 2 protein, partial [Candidatus Latescibacteria bacterium]|nr:glycosyltransferase family 2 protein [Candidatus Latescibacterota bacterium]